MIVLWLIVDERIASATTVGRGYPLHVDARCMLRPNLCLVARVFIRAGVFFQSDFLTGGRRTPSSTMRIFSSAAGSF